MDPLETANNLLTHLSKERAIEHTNFVLSPGYGLLKKELRKFWEEVREILKREEKYLVN